MSYYIEVTPCDPDGTRLEREYLLTPFPLPRFTKTLSEAMTFESEKDAFLIARCITTDFWVDSKNPVYAGFQVLISEAKATVGADESAGMLAHLISSAQPLKDYLPELVRGLYESIDKIEG